MIRKAFRSKYSAAQFVLDESSSSRAVNSLKAMLGEVCGGEQMLGLLEHVLREHRMTVSRLEWAENRIKELEAVATEEA